MKDAFKLIPNFIRKMSYLFIVTVFSILSLNSSVYADVGQDLTYPFYSAKSVCTQNSSPSNLKSGDSVYILGDSISVYTEANYRSELAKSGLQPTINGSTGRSWIGGGSYTPTTGGSLKPAKEAVQDDKASIQGAKAIVIALGSNGGLNGNPIGEMIDTIREINPNSPIFWVNLAGTSKWTGVNLSYMGPFNQALTTESTAKNFRIIDWFSQVNPGGNPDSQPTIDKEGVLADGLHPNTSGVQKLSTLVASSLGSSTAPTENLNTGNCQCSAGGSGSVELIGNDNTEKAFRYFLGKGLSPEQAAGILGNMTIESGVDPENIQDPGGRSQNPNDAGSAGWGLIQWTPGSKVINIAKNANINTPIYELGTQLEVVWWHMNNTSPTGVKNFIEKFKQTTTVEEATADFEDRMEGAGVTAIPRRVKFAQDILASYGGSAPNQSGGGASSASCPTGGGAGQNIGNFVVYSQYDPAWKDLPYSSSTIGVAGCGPSAMAMIISTLTGQKVTPVDTANYAASQGMYISGSGSSWQIGEVVAKQWGLKAEPLQKDIAQITQALQQGKLIITPGSGPKPFTSGGHFIVIRGVTPSGKFLVGDSGHKDTSDKEWDPQQIISSMRPGGIYAISK